MNACTHIHTYRYTHRQTARYTRNTEQINATHLCMHTHTNTHPHTQTHTHTHTHTTHNIYTHSPDSHRQYHGYLQIQINETAAARDIRHTHHPSFLVHPSNC